MSNADGLRFPDWVNGKTSLTSCPVIAGGPNKVKTVPPDSLSRDPKLAPEAEPSGKNAPEPSHARAIETLLPAISDALRRDMLPLALSFPKPRPTESVNSASMEIGREVRPFEAAAPEKTESLAAAPGELAFHAEIRLHQPGELGPQPSPIQSENKYQSPGALLASEIKRAEAAPSSVGAADGMASPAQQVKAGIELNEVQPGAKPSVPVRPFEPITEIRSTPVAAPSLKEISFQIPGSRGVEIKLTESAGQVRIDVRSGDAMLTRDLRGNLHELVSSLDKKGFNSEVSHPVESTVLNGGLMDSSSHAASSHGSSDGQNDPTGRHPREQSERERQNPSDPSDDRRNQKPPAVAWYDAIQTHLETRQA